jgi:hypothetical protein
MAKLTMSTTTGIGKTGDLDNLVLVQLSDLHMSDKLETATFNRKPGLRGHDPLLCRLLATRMRYIAAAYGTSASDLRWVVSGDLTRVGAEPEFGVARDFLGSIPPRDRLGRPQRPTLGISRDRWADVPGNHDHFDGWDEESLMRAIHSNPPPAWNPHLFPGVFKQSPWDSLATPWMSSKGSFQLELFGVDSSSGHAGEKANRSAAGHIADGEFALLEDALHQSNTASDPKGVTCVRAIVCHHAFTKRPQSGWLKASPLRRACVQRLTELAAVYKVAAILTGHTHMQHFRKCDVICPQFGEAEPSRHTIHELRNPATLQGPAEALSNGFWVHHVFRAPEGHVLWQPRLYMLAAGRFHVLDVNDLEDFMAP